MPWVGEEHYAFILPFVIEYLMKNIGQVVTHSALAEAVWGEEYLDSTDSLRVYIRRLRQKIEINPDEPHLILTRSGVGYSLAKEG